ncbi:MAG: heavy metal-binding domain-containing protein, partial [Ferruginibacter sp.]
MKTLKTLMMAALTILTISAFAQKETTDKTKAPKHQTEKMKYCCAMHPEVMSDKPGKCPKCEMALV